MKPLILDFDGAVKALPDEQRIDLQGWQESIRFGCKKNVLNQLENAIDDALDVPHGTVFMGSGDYHHVSHLLIRRYANLGMPLQVVVFDNHPDNMRYPFGIHCGSWVWHISRLPFVSNVHVIGITSTDVEAAHGWENHLRNLRAGRVRYWCVGRDLGWMKSLGITGSRSFSSTAALLEAFSSHISSTDAPVYLSIDKDVLSPEDAHTNWDQGVMRLTEMQSAIAMLKGRIVGSDVTGEVSVYHYQSRFKRLLSGMDGQSEINDQDIAAWQVQHQQINQNILDILDINI
jgi:arginase family enzyme